MSRILYCYILIKLMII